MPHYENFDAPHSRLAQDDSVMVTVAVCIAYDEVPLACLAAPRIRALLLYVGSLLKCLIYWNLYTFLYHRREQFSDS